jgi:hypothetical protein
MKRMGNRVQAIFNHEWNEWARMKRGRIGGEFSVFRYPCLSVIRDSPPSEDSTTTGGGAGDGRPLFIPMPPSNAMEGHGGRGGEAVFRQN